MKTTDYAVFCNILSLRPYFVEIGPADPKILCRVARKVFPDEP